MRRILSRYTRGQIILCALGLLALLVVIGMFVPRNEPASQITPGASEQDTGARHREQIVIAVPGKDATAKLQKQSGSTNAPATASAQSPLAQNSLEQNSRVQPPRAQNPRVQNLRVQNYSIKKGDTLSEIFETKGLSATLLHYLLSADTEYLSLETLQPGTQLTFRFDDKHKLESLTLHVDPARNVVFSRQSDDSFDYQKIEAATHWQSDVVTGSVTGSFYTSGLKAGLSERHVAELTHLLKGKLNFRRDLRAGDQFEVVVDHEMTKQKATGETRIDAVSLQRGNNTYNAFLFDDGSYYDEKGDSVLPAFRRWPTARHYRVTSPFDLHRLHPITGRKAPHNGVDLAAPSGTTVMSTGDGVVSRIGNHPYAGKYIDIDYSGSFSTRYLHLSKILVRRGERIKRGEKIALSGNTGRTTGPHLHFELHINGHPVNPLTANIPLSKSIPANKMKAFKAQVSKQLALMQSATEESANVADEGSARDQTEKGG